jgi:hypothetical protein
MFLTEKGEAFGPGFWMNYSSVSITLNKDIPITYEEVTTHTFFGLIWKFALLWANGY